MELQTHIDLLWCLIFPSEFQNSWGIDQRDLPEYKKGIIKDCYYVNQKPHEGLTWKPEFTAPFRPTDKHNAATAMVGSQPTNSSPIRPIDAPHWPTLWKVFLAWVTLSVPVAMRLSETRPQTKEKMNQQRYGRADRKPFFGIRKKRTRLWQTHNKTGNKKSQTYSLLLMEGFEFCWGKLASLWGGCSTPSFPQSGSTPKPRKGLRSLSSWTEEEEVVDLYSKRGGWT